MNVNKKVSVIIPCYNQQNFIEETIDSVLRQTYLNWECVIVDDGSTDNSLSVIKAKIGVDERFKVLSIDNSGVANARNQGVENAVGDFVLPLDGDDKINKDYLRLAVNYFDKYPETDLLYCNASYFGTKKGLWILPEYSYSFLMNGNCIFCSAMYKREDFINKTQGYDVELKYGYEDWEFWLQLLNENSVVVKLPEVLFYYRQNEDVSRNASVLEENKLNITLKHIYGKHFDVFFNFHGGEKQVEQTRHSLKGEFIKYIKDNNLVLNENLGTKTSSGQVYLMAERFKAIKKTFSYKVFVKLELSIRKKIKNL